MVTKKQFRQEDCPTPIRVQLIQLMRQAWPNAFDDVSDEQVIWPDTPDTHPVSLVYLDGDTIISHVAVPRKKIQHEGRVYTAYGISEMMTNPAYRRQGYGLELLREAAAYIQDQRPDLSIFTCEPHLISFYEQAGWTYMPGTHLIGGTRKKPFRSDSFGLATMVSFLSDEAKRDAESFRMKDVYVELGERKLW
ncbi:GNAT family N-acetyltransferase [Paenibacillus guangzhouensis]|uniref:GNAT family N-acetyltransferase n=1 Tax=Paenibacillus guangzhouensis TaxID=1473112 RepID=UPI001266E500|nr:GNAT family N-acetyltransferase [Paenibacillus guangzhouensis]